MSFEINPKELSLQDAAGMQLANLIRKLANEVGEGGASSLAGLSDVDLTGVAAGDGIVFDGQKFKAQDVLPVFTWAGDEISVGAELSENALKSLLNGKPFMLYNVDVFDADYDIISSGGINIVWPHITNNKVGSFEIAGSFNYNGGGGVYTVLVSMENDGVTIASVNQTFTTKPLEISITVTSADMSTGTVSGATYTQIRNAVLDGRKVHASIADLGSTFEVNCYDNAGVSGIFAGPHPVSGTWVLVHVYISQTGATARMFTLTSV